MLLLAIKFCSGSDLLLTNVTHFYIFQSEHKGCFFHLTQAIHRRVAHLRLLHFYNDPNFPETRNYVRKLMALALLPPAEVANAFQAQARNAPQVPGLHRITDYFHGMQTILSIL